MKKGKYKIRWIIGFSAFFFLLLLLIIPLKKEIGYSVEVCGRSIEDRDYYILYKEDPGVGKMKCTKEHYDELYDVERNDTLYIAIYERKSSLLWSELKAVKLRKFKVNLDDSTHKNIVTNLTYYRLIDEVLTSVNKDNSLFTRVYECYGLDSDKMVLQTTEDLTPYFSNLSSAKEWLKRNKPVQLKLRGNTIVGQELLKRWEDEGYVPEFEYTKESPKGLTLEKLIEK